MHHAMMISLVVCVWLWKACRGHSSAWHPYSRCYVMINLVRCRFHHRRRRLPNSWMDCAIDSQQSTDTFIRATFLCLLMLFRYSCCYRSSRRSHRTNVSVTQTRTIQQHFCTFLRCHMPDGSQRWVFVSSVQCFSVCVRAAHRAKADRFWIVSHVKTQTFSSPLRRYSQNAHGVLFGL